MYFNEVYIAWNIKVFALKCWFKWKKNVTKKSVNTWIQSVKVLESFLKINHRGGKGGEGRREELE